MEMFTENEAVNKKKITSVKFIKINIYPQYAIN